MGGLKDALLSSVLRDYHKSLAERLAEVLRRREELVATASSSGSSLVSIITTTAAITTGVVAIGSSTRQLTVAELRAAEQIIPTPSLEWVKQASLRQKGERTSVVMIINE